jgi:hypothetical protein
MGVPALVVLAYRDWSRKLRLTLARWRNYVGLASLALSFANWSLWVLVVTGTLMNLRFPPFFYSMEGVESLALAGFAASVLGLGLKGASRIQAMAAGILMAALLISGVVS